MELQPALYSNTCSIWPCARRDWGATKLTAKNAEDDGRKTAMRSVTRPALSISEAAAVVPPTPLSRPSSLKGKCSKGPRRRSGRAIRVLTPPPPARRGEAGRYPGTPGDVRTIALRTEEGPHGLARHARHLPASSAWASSFHAGTLSRASHRTPLKRAAAARALQRLRAVPSQVIRRVYSPASTDLGHKR